MRKTPLRSALQAAVLAGGLAAAGPATAGVMLINVFEVPPGKEAEAVAAWEKARDFLAAQPGYVSTALHRALTPDARFRLVNVAVWESPQAYGAAIAAMQQAKVFPRIEGLKINPALYEVIRSDAETAQ